MSGGRLGYFFSTMEDHIGDFKDKELDDLVKDLAKLFRDRELYLSGDTGKGDWNESRDAFKEKWFTEHGRQDRIDFYISEFADEVRKTFEISRKYCKFCMFWTGRENPFYDGKYGKCPFINGCLMHRSDTCERWEAIEE